VGEHERQLGLLQHARLCLSTVLPTALTNTNRSQEPYPT
jgi:hypothetical protein